MCFKVFLQKGTYVSVAWVIPFQEFYFYGITLSWWFKWDVSFSPWVELHLLPSTSSLSQKRQWHAPLLGLFTIFLLSVLAHLLFGLKLHVSHSSVLRRLDVSSRGENWTAWVFLFFPWDLPCNLKKLRGAETYRGIAHNGTYFSPRPLSYIWELKSPWVSLTMFKNLFSLGFSPLKKKKEKSKPAPILVH